MSRVIVVTTRVDTDAELRRLRRSGARYVIVRPPHVIDADAWRGKRVLVPRGLTDAACVTIDDLARATLEAVRDRARTYRPLARAIGSGCIRLAVSRGADQPMGSVHFELPL